MVVEKLIYFRPFSLLETKEKEKKFNELLISQESFLKNSPKIHQKINVKQVIKRLLNDSSTMEICQHILKSSKKEIWKFNFPFCLQHGDLWNRNILISIKGEIFLVDFENFGFDFFLKDFFHFVNSEIIFFKEFRFLEKYFLGNFDGFLYKIFNYFNLDFDENLKKEYYFSFLLLRLNEDLEKKEKSTSWLEKVFFARSLERRKIRYFEIIKKTKIFEKF